MNPLFRSAAFSLISSLVVSSLGSVSRADDWSHNCLSGEGSKVSVDFTQKYLDHNDSGGPAGTLATNTGAAGTGTYVNVTGGLVSGGSWTGGEVTSVVAQIQNYSYPVGIGSIANQEAIQLETASGAPFNVSLTFEENTPLGPHYSGLVQGPIEISGVKAPGSGTPDAYFFQTMTIFVNHAVGGTSTIKNDDGTAFQFQMSAAGSDACN